MSRGQLPKAYLRIDPNLDQHPDAELILRLLCAANRQEPRGRWRSWAHVVTAVGRARAERAKNAGHVVEAPGGVWILHGWDDWQEGDITVGERMSRLRERRNSTVTQPSPDPSHLPSPPSEASRRQGTDNGQGTSYPPPVAVVAPPALVEAPATDHGHGNGAGKEKGHGGRKGVPTWLTPFGDSWRERWGAESEPPWGEMAQQFTRPLKELERDDFAARWVRFLASADRAEWARPARFVQGLGQWAEQPAGLVVMRGQQAVGAQSAKATARRAEADSWIRAGLKGDGTA